MLISLIAAMNLNSQHSMRLLAKIPFKKDGRPYTFTDADILWAAREIVSEDNAKY